MSKVKVGILVGKSLKAMGVEMVFFIIGGPMQTVIKGCFDEGIRLIDVRHEQAAALMAHAYSRVTGKTGVCSTGTGCDTINTATGVYNAFLDCAPLVAIGGSVATFSQGTDAFQEADQVSLMKPITKRAWKVINAERIPEFIAAAFRSAISGKPGPVYLDFPRDILSADVDEDQIKLHTLPDMGHPPGDERLVEEAVKILEKAERPVVIAGSGAIWSEAGAALQEFVESTRIPFYTTPLARGLIPEDHPLCFLAARSFALREADVILVVGTRTSMIIHHLIPPFVAKDVKVIMVNIDPDELGHNRPVDVGILGDAKAVLRQLTEQARGRFAKKSRSLNAWAEKLKEVHDQRIERESAPLYSDEIPIHPMRLCKEIRDFLPRDAILVQDGNEILHFGRQWIPSYYPRHRLNPGIGGDMGCGVPFGIGAKLARPEKSVLVLSGDGSFGQNAIEVDVAVRHKVPVVIAISNNGGWSGLPSMWPTGARLGDKTRYDKMAESLGCWGQMVEKPQDIRPALENAFASGKPAVVNVITSPVRAEFQEYSPFQAGLHPTARPVSKK